MPILDKIRCPICGGMGAQLRNIRDVKLLEDTKFTGTTTIACKHCDAELDDRPDGDLTATYIREALKERKGDTEGKYLSRRPIRRGN